MSICGDWASSVAHLSTGVTAPWSVSPVRMRTARLERDDEDLAVADLAGPRARRRARRSPAATNVVGDGDLEADLVGQPHLHGGAAVGLDALELTAVALHAAHRDTRGPRRGRAPPARRWPSPAGRSRSRVSRGFPSHPGRSLPRLGITGQPGPTASDTYAMPAESEDSTFTLYAWHRAARGAGLRGGGGAPRGGRLSRPESPRCARRWAAPISAPAACRARGRVQGRGRARSGQRLRPLLPRPGAGQDGGDERARHHLALASNLLPDRSDYSFDRAMLGASERPLRFRSCPRGRRGRSARIEVPLPARSADPGCRRRARRARASRSGRSRRAARRDRTRAVVADDAGDEPSGLGDADPHRRAPACPTAFVSASCTSR